MILDPAVLPDKPEGYQMEVASGKITIKSSTSAGVLNGIQTLRQIIEEKTGNIWCKELLFLIIRLFPGGLSCWMKDVILKVKMLC